jgi:uncharacterized protein (TIGR00661 family)
VQGEGRGHLTQALALRTLLEARGHTVCGVLVGRSDGRKLPAFFTDGIGAPVFLYDSPNFAYDGNAVSLSRTVREATRRSWIYAHTLQLIHRQVEAHRPDVIVNFYEGMTGLYSLAFRPPVPVVCVGHQYMFHHPAYRFAPGQRVGQAALRAYTRLTAAGAVRRLALSFYPVPDVMDRATWVVPPLLRRDLFALDGDADEGFLLVYLLNAGMAESIEAWHRRRRDTRLHCFWDREPYRPHPNLTFHPLCGERFLRFMARARGVVCTAGFESISEAMWLGKPVCMIPTPGHLEQRTNALDAGRIGAGVYSRHFDLDDFVHYLDREAPEARRATRQTFRAWVESGEARFVSALEAVVERPGPARVGASGGALETA